MKPLTPKQRREIYLKVAEEILITENTLCCTLHSIYPFVYAPSYLTDTACDYFTEFALFRPFEPLYVWFDNSRERIICMLLCAEIAKTAKQ